MTRSVGRYEILRELGRGGMAIVYLARQPDLDRHVALKELSAFHASDPQFARRFLRESRLAGSLSHPNIVTVHDYFEWEGTPYIAMEYVSRGSLRPYVGRLSLAQVIGVIEGILAGLAHAETKGIVHRDLKPENVMVNEEGRVKIADFGIAKAGSGLATGAFLTATGTTVGTPAYMAPEQAMAQEVGPWTDLYSLGVMAYEMLVGRLPFPEDEAPMAILMRQVNDPVPPPRSLSPDLDDELADWIERMLVKDPAQRIRNAPDAWDELEESVIRIFGARWRREARLPAPAAASDLPRPLTPAPFKGAPTSDSADESAEFQSFEWKKPGDVAAPPAPAAPAPTPPAAEPVADLAPYVVSAEAAAAARAAETAAPRPGETPAPQAAGTAAPPQAGTAAPVTDETGAPPQPGTAAPPGAGTAAPPQAGTAAPPSHETAAPQAGTVAPQSGTAAPSGAGTAAPSAAGTAAPPQAGAAAPPGAGTASPPQAGTAAPPRSGTAAPSGGGTIAPAAAGAAAAAMAGAAAAPPAEAGTETPATNAEAGTATGAEPPQRFRTYGHRTEAPPPAPAVEEPAEAEEAAPEPEDEWQPTVAPASVPRAQEAEAAAPAATAEAPSRRFSGKAIGILAACVVAAIGIGYLVAPSSNKETPAPALGNSASNGPLQVRYPDAWHQSGSGPQVNGLQFSDEIALAGAQPGQAVRAGMTDATGPTLLPKQLLARLGADPKHDSVRLGQVAAYRYRQLKASSPQQRLTVYAVPTTKGVATLACIGAAASSPDCEAIATTVRLNGVKTFPLGANADYAKTLNTTMSTLNSRVLSGRRQLAKARTRAGQAKAAAALAGAYRTAASALQRASVSPADRAAHDALVTALQNASSAYARLASAANRGSKAAYAQAERAVAATERKVNTAIAAMRQLGYTPS